MQRLLTILNSSFGLLVSGALISGLCVQYITATWQARNWLLEQHFTAEKVQFEKELDQKYKVLEEINTEVAGILARSQYVVIGREKQVPARQMDQLVNNYNEAVQRWDTGFRLYSIRIQVLFSDKEISAKWNAIKTERDKLDVAIYEATQTNPMPSELALQLIDRISNLTVELSRQMMGDIRDMQHRDFR